MFNKYQNSCPRYVFRCSYGACIDNDLKCNGVPNCADGSDEDRSICGGRPPSRPTEQTTKRPSYDQTDRTTTRDPYNVNSPRPTERPIQRPTQTTPSNSRPKPKPTGQPSRPLLPSCPVPEQPQNGRWVLENSQCRDNYVKCNVAKGIRDLDPGTALVYSCNQGYKVSGSSNVYCKNTGEWSKIPTCQG